MAKINRADMVLSLNRVLLGEVSPKLREVEFSSDDRYIYLRFFYDQDLDDDDRDSTYTIAATVASDFPGYSLKDEIISGDSLPHIAPHGIAWETAYARR